MSDDPAKQAGGPIDRQPGTNRRRLAIGAIAVVALGGIGAAVLTGGDEEPATAQQAAPPALTVTAQTPRIVEWPVTLSASGAIAAWQEASIGTQIGSYQLVDVRVNVGDRVRRGQVLARLDPALLRAEEAQLVASAEQGEANRRRALGLQQSGAISDQDVLQAVTTARTSAASLQATRTRLRYTNVVAPDWGTISARSATLGAVVPAGEELFRLIRQDRLEWRGELTADKLGEVRIGQEIDLKLPDGSTATAKVRQTSPSLDAETRLAIVYADVRPGSRARAGMFATGDVELGASQALVVPAESVIIRDGRSHVLVLADNSAAPRVSLRNVEVGRRRGTDAEIVRGLRRGEHVVVRGAGFLKDRDVVRVATSDRPAGNARP